MVTFRSNNNNRRPAFRNNNRRPAFRRNDEGSKFSNNDTFQRKVPGRNNHNASKLIDKYNDLAREALANEDKILSENYFQHADHFTRIQNEQEKIRKARVNNNPIDTIKSNNIDEMDKDAKKEDDDKIVNAVEKTEKKVSEKKTATS